jgi:hypothetical protein
VSELNTPHQLGMGMKVIESSDEMIKVLLPHRLRNRCESGAIHIGALTTLAEYAAKTYWQRQLHYQTSDISLHEMASRIFETAHRDIHATSKVQGEERERIMLTLEKEGEVMIDSQVVIYGQKEQKVAEFLLVWKAKAPKVVKEADNIVSIN